MRIAFADLLYSWPPHGGADVDVYRTIEGLRALGHEVHLFGAACGATWERGRFAPDELPFPATRLDFSTPSFNRRQVPKRFRAAVDAWRPQVVCVTDGFLLKPYLIDALAHYPTISRYYAYEAVCARDILCFKDGAPCPNNFLRTPDVCRRCAFDRLGPEVRQWHLRAWTHEYLAARAFMPHYHRRALNALRKLSAVIVSNDRMKAQLEGFNHRIHIMPGGVDTDAFSEQPPPPKGHDVRKVILMAGRIEDPVKGLGILYQAARELAVRRSDFEVWVTGANVRVPEAGWFKTVGWHGQDGLKELYRQADICVVPSIWEEPFGLIAVEAMAAAKPVCASRVGGLQRIVRDGQTGFLFERGDTIGLADRLERLLDDAALRERMGAAGRSVACDEYDWDRVIARHWPPLLDEVLP